MLARRTYLRTIAAATGLLLVLAACSSDEVADDPVDTDATETDDASDPGGTSDGDGDGPDEQADATGPDDVEEPDEEPDEEVEEEPADPQVDPAEVGADELGLVPVLMYHQLRDDGGSEWDMSPDEFRAELTYLFDEGYRPVSTIDLVRREFDIPAGTTPVVLTFDDSPRNQAFLDDDGELHPDSSMGILIDVASDYDDVDPVASLYVITSSMFGGGNDDEQIVTALHEAGMELGNHTHTHPGLASVSAGEVQDELATAAATLQGVDPDIEVATLSLPLGQFPEDRSLAASGSGSDGDYDHEAVLLVGSNPAPSPFHAEFDALALPRIQTHPDPEYLNGSTWWFEQLERGEAYRRYVSDGEPDTISFPEERADEIDPSFEDLANPY